MRILLITTLYPLYDSDCQSVTTALKEFVAQWQRSNEVHVVRPLINNAHISERSDQQFSVIKAIRIPGLECYFVNTKKLVHAIPFQPEIVVSHMYKSYLWAWKIADHFQVPFVAGIHNSDIQLMQLPTMRARLNRVYSRADGLACRSPAMRTQLLKRSPRLLSKSFCATSGVAENIIQPLSFFQDKVRRWHKSKEIRFTTVARLQKCKNIDVTLRALSLLPGNLRWTFRVIGDGRERNRLQALSCRLDISDRVSFPGWLPRDQVFHELLRSDIFILVSAPETFGLAYIEALAAGNIVVGAKNWGVDGFITDRLNGYFCAPKDIDDLLSTIRHIAIDSSEQAILQLVTRSHELASANTASMAAEAYRRQLQSICHSSR